MAAGGSAGGLSWASAKVDNSTQANRIADHPLIVATTAGSSAGCAVDSGTAEAKYNLGPVKPYVGAGLNYTRFSSVNLPAGVSIDKNSFGGALQVGVDIPVAKNVSLNLDLKKVYIRTDVSAGGAKLGTFKVDPVLFGVGVGYRF